MHCELVVPGLLAAAKAARPAALETLFARGRRSSAAARSPEAWLMEQFDAGEGLPAGALTLLAHGMPADGAWARADPVHLQLMRDRAVIVPGAALHISAAEAQALCATLNAQLEGRLALRICAPDCWVARIDTRLALPQAGAIEMAGRAAAPGLSCDGLLNEAQMALHEHPVNEARAARGEPAINSLWLWGSGVAPAAGAAPWRSVSANDAVALGLAHTARTASRRLPASAPAWIEACGGDGRHLALLDGLRAPLALSDPQGALAQLLALERDWFAPLLAALRAGRIGMASVHIPDADEATAVETVRGDLRRFWRRPRPIG